jgi:sensor histidine kinase YesM
MFDSRLRRRDLPTMLLFGAVPVTWKTWAGVIGSALFLGVLSWIHHVLGAWGQGELSGPGRQFLVIEAFWLSYAALLPVLFLAADRYRLAFWRLTTIAIHATGATAFTYVHFFLFSLIVVYVIPTPSAPAPEGATLFYVFSGLIRRNFVLDFLTYWVIVAFTHMGQYQVQLRQRELAAAELRTSLTNARLKALQDQLNPHFFFNTLHIISSLAISGRSAAVTDTVARLSDLLRVSFDETRPSWIPLRRELEFVDSYLEIHRLWYGDRLNVRRVIATNVLDALVPCMMLQPIVENAIVHGVAARPGPGRLVLEGERLNGSLRLRISDNGPGLWRNSRRRKGVGLANTEQRLEQLYGTDCHIEYGTSVEGGACVTISIPFLCKAPPSSLRLVERPS